MAIRLPEKFEKRMRELLGEEYEAFAKGYEIDHAAGLRVNTMKLAPQEFEKLAPVAVRRIPWIKNGFYYDADAAQPAKHPYYFAGMYYIQEPSAMTPAQILPVTPHIPINSVTSRSSGTRIPMRKPMRDTNIIRLKQSNNV